MKIWKCVVANCGKRSDEGVRLFRIPKQDEISWCKNLGILNTEIKSTTRVCDRHFEEEWLGLKNLKFGARPTLCLGKETIEALPVLKGKRIFKARQCCIVSCPTTAPSFLLSFPKDEKRLNLWLAICKIKEEVKNHKSKFICANHFEPSFIVNRKLRKDALPKMEGLDCPYGSGEFPTGNVYEARTDVTIKKENENDTNFEEEYLPNNTSPSSQFYDADNPNFSNLSTSETLIKTEDVTNMEYECFPHLNETDATTDESDTSSKGGLECRNLCYACNKFCDNCLVFRKKLESIKAVHAAEIQTLRNEISKLKAQLQAQVQVDK